MGKGNTSVSARLARQAKAARPHRLTEEQLAQVAKPVEAHHPSQCPERRDAQEIARDRRELLARQICNEAELGICSNAMADPSILADEIDGQPYTYGGQR